MSNVVNFFKSTSFDPETVKLLCDAYDKACVSLHGTGQPYIVNEVLASRIIAMAKHGERDPDRLCAKALMGIGAKAAEGK